MKGKHKRSKPPALGGGVCWWCSRKLLAGGKYGAEIVGHDGNKHVVHKACADEAVAYGAEMA